MGRVVISENISLDGVIEDPTGDQGLAHGGWFNRIGDADRAAWAEVELEEARSADALLLGRGSYEYFHGRWADRTGEWADRLNALPKHVVSSTLVDPAWTNAVVLEGDVVASVTALREQTAGDIVVYASGGLVPLLIEHDLVDELRLIVYPVLLGGSHSLFRAVGGSRPLRLLDARRLGDVLAQLSYEVVRDDRAGA